MGASLKQPGAEETNARVTIRPEGTEEAELDIPEVLQRRTPPTAEDPADDKNGCGCQVGCQPLGALEALDIVQSDLERESAKLARAGPEKARVGRIERSSWLRRALLSLGVPAGTLDHPTENILPHAYTVDVATRFFYLLAFLIYITVKVRECPRCTARARSSAHKRGR